MCFPHHYVIGATLMSHQEVHMSYQTGSNEYLSKLKRHLEAERYAPDTVYRCMSVARGFLADLCEQHVDIAAVRPAYVDDYLKRRLRKYQQRHGRLPGYKSWRCLQNDGIRMLLRVVQVQWPPASAPCTDAEVLRREICESYAGWIGMSCGRSAGTIHNRCAEADRFLVWLDRRSTRQTPATLMVGVVDAYMRDRARSLSRSTLSRVASDMRGFLRWLHMTERTSLDLSSTVVAPSLYALESIPSVVRTEDVKKVLAVTRKDTSPKGLRDYAILLLLSTYGMRAGEITTLRLDDLDWRKEVIRVRHSKTGATSYLPLLADAGEAVLRYLQKARPATALREVFLRCKAPYCPFQAGSNISRLVQGRFERAGVVGSGKCNPHSFRHARAVSMLRAGIPSKEIGDLLGHRSSDSTTVYLKLATDDLRAVALEIPMEVNA